MKHETFGIFQLYMHTVPANVRAIEGATFKEWQAALEPWGRAHHGSCPQRQRHHRLGPYSDRTDRPPLDSFRRSATLDGVIGPPRPGSLSPSKSSPWSNRTLEWQPLSASATNPQTATC